MAKFRPWYLLIPAVGLLAFIDLAPFFYMLYLSFQRWILVSSKPVTYIGFDNYQFLVNDAEFLNAFVRGVTFAVLGIIIQLVAGLGAAFIMIRKFRGAALFKVILVLPLAVAPVAIGSMWRLMMFPGVGPIPYYLEHYLGFEWNLTGNSEMAFATTILMDTWHWLPLAALILLSGIAGISPSILESAMLDGVGSWQKLRFIYLPLIRFEILFVVLLRGMDAFRIFDEIWMLTGGGPGGATRFLSVSLYTLILKGWDIGYGAAVSIVYLYVIIVLCWTLYQAVTRVSD
jgi:multiple sugar transport system permease protein